MNQRQGKGKGDDFLPRLLLLSVSLRFLSASETQLGCLGLGPGSADGRLPGRQGDLETDLENLVSREVRGCCPQPHAGSPLGQVGPLLTW